MNNKWKLQLPLHVMIIPGLLLVLIFSYGPMLGIVMAFQKFTPAKGISGSPWIGFSNFVYVFKLNGFYQVIWNTIYIACLKIVAGLVVPIIVAILLNEIRREYFKRFVQTLVYLPHFLSWVILSGVLIDILSPSNGILNQGLQWLGIDPIFFMGDNHWFPYTLVLSNEWKEFGFSTIIYLAAITGINPSLYEAAVIDGANHWKRMWHVTLPGMAPIIVLLVTLNIGNVLNAGFEQVFNMYSPVVYQSGDIIDTFVYRMGIVDAQYGVATAVGLFKSVVSLVMLSTSYILAYRLANYRVF